MPESAGRPSSGTFGGRGLRSRCPPPAVTAQVWPLSCLPSGEPIPVFEVSSRFKRDSREGRRLVCTVATVACLVGYAPAAAAQAFEVAPFVGYRFGGQFFELATRQPVDADGAPALGIVVDVDLPPTAGLQFEALFTHQEVRVLAAGPPFSPTPEVAAAWHVAVDQWAGGALQEFSGGSIRPFLTGLVGLTRYASEEDAEVRFALAAGGGVKMFPASRLGVRLEGRVFTTIIEVDAHAVACTPGCVGVFRLDVVWQAEFTAGIVFRFH
jgi:DNA-binding transcriptional LysR family regulator